MDLDALLGRCRQIEERAAALYRAFAAAARGEPNACALWTQLAREEECHAESIRRAKDARRIDAPRTSVDGWEETIAEAEERLATAERLGPRSTTSEQLAAALDLEITELETLRRAVLAAAGVPAPPDAAGHAERLAAAAEALSDDPQIRLAVALLRARERLGATADSSAARPRRSR
jgi:hypothetical protein